MRYYFWLGAEAEKLDHYALIDPRAYQQLKADLDEIYGHDD